MRPGVRSPTVGQTINFVVQAALCIDGTMPEFVKLEDAAGLVRDGDRVGIGGCLFSRLPLLLVEAVANRAPRELEYVAWGGGLPLELLLQAGSVRRLVFCFSSLDVFGLAPRFRHALEGSALDVEELPALAMVQGFQARRHRLPSLAFRLPTGSDVLTHTTLTRTHPDPITGERVGFAAALQLDVLLMHAQRADQDGNVEIQGALGQDLLGPCAARRLVVTVEEIVPSGLLQRERRGVIVPRELVTAVVHSPLAAYPTSCLPFYAADYRAISRMIARQPLAVPAAEGRADLMRRAARTLHAGVMATNNRARAAIDGPATAAERLVATLAREYSNESVVSAGAVSPVALASYLLAKHTHAPDMTIITTSGGYVDVAARPLLLGLGEVLDFQTAVAHASGDDTYHVYYQPGRVSHEVVAAAQVDRLGHVNTIEVRSPSGRRVRLPGQGGMADVADMHQNFVVYIPRHSRLALVEHVDVVSASRSLLTDDERLAAGLRPGSVKVITNLCSFELDHGTRELVVTKLQPGVTLEDVGRLTGFAVVASTECAELASPTPDELRILRTRVDPLGISRLELVQARERGGLLDELFDGEEHWINEAASWRNEPRPEPPSQPVHSSDRSHQPG